MSRGLILGVGLIALTLLVLICIPRHLPVAASDAPRPAFHVSIEHGRLTLTGTVGSEEAKQAAITRAQEAAKTAGLRVSHEIDVAHEGGAAEWEQALPALIAPLTTLQHQQATLSLSDHAVLLKGTASSGEAKSRLLREVASLVGSAVNVQDQVTVATGSSVAVAAPAQPHAPHPSRQQTQAGLDDILRSEQIGFESNSAVLTPRGRAVVDRLVAVLKRTPEATVEIGGHTDSYGDPEYNLQLSRRRADTVRQYLLDHAVTNPLTAVGYGSTRPLSQERTRAASKKNRRIELRVKEER